jgi:TniQ protein
VTSPDRDGRLPPPPVRPRPAAGETVSSYVRRLAIANHLRPSYLHGYLAGPPSYLHGIKPGRLAALSGRTVAGLDRVLTGLTRQPSRQPSRRKVRASDKPGLFAVIRRDAQDGHSIRALAGRHQVHRRTIRQALSDPVPPPRKQMPRRGHALDRLHVQINAMLAAEPGLTGREIWERLIDEHDMAVSYASVSSYLIRLRAALSPDA